MQEVNAQLPYYEGTCFRTGFSCVAAVKKNPNPRSSSFQSTYLQIRFNSLNNEITFFDSVKIAFFIIPIADKLVRM